MTISDLRKRVRTLTNTTETSFTNTQINEGLTDAAHLFVAEIIDAMDDWDFQGEISTTNLIADQSEYVFPTDILRIKRIEVSYDGTNWYKANIFDMNEKRDRLTGGETSDFNTTTPKVDLHENSIFIYPTPTSTITAGLKIWYSKEAVGVDALGTDITEFVNGTDKPNIRAAFQKGLAYGVAHDYAIKYDIINKISMFENMIEKTIARMRNFYGKKSERDIILQTNSKLEDYE